MTNFVQRPDEVKVFAGDSQHGNYLPVRFATNIPAAKDKLGEITNTNFDYGLESLENDLQMKDLNTVLFYQSSLLKYLFQRGVSEFSPFEDYPQGALVQRNGELWVATKQVLHTQEVKEVAQSTCTPCGMQCEVVSTVCGTAVEPSKDTGWCKLVTHCEYDAKIEALENANVTLQTAIGNLKGVEGFSILPNAKTSALELSLRLSDGSALVIPMTKFGHIKQAEDGRILITNADNSTLELPKYVAEKDLNQDKGFYFNKQSNKWEVNLADLVKTGSGLTVDKSGNISVVPVDTVDGVTLSTDPKTGKARIDPDWYKHNVTEPVNEALDGAKTYTDEALDDLAERGANVYVKAPITGSGLKTDPIKLTTGSGLKVDKDSLALDVPKAIELLANPTNGALLLKALKDGKLLGDGLDIVNGKLVVKTETVYDASGTEVQFYAVDK